MNFAIQLRRWRDRRGWTQATLAQAAGIPRPNLINIENGKRDCTLTTLTRLAQALGISPGTLLEQAPPSIDELDRFEIDAIAKSYWKEDLPLAPKLKTICDMFFPIVGPILRAAGKPRVSLKTTRRAWDYRQKALDYVGKENFQRIIRRVNKMAAGQGVEGAK